MRGGVGWLGGWVVVLVSWLIDWLVAMVGWLWLVGCWLALVLVGCLVCGFGLFVG